MSKKLELRMRVKLVDWFVFVRFNGDSCGFNYRRNSLYNTPTPTLGGMCA